MWMKTTSEGKAEVGIMKDEVRQRFSLRTGTEREWVPLSPPGGAREKTAATQHRPTISVRPRRKLAQ
jgi:hypothetical protein